MVACPPVTYGLLLSPARTPNGVAEAKFHPTSAALPDLVMVHSTGFPDVPSEAELGSNGALFAETPLFPVPAPVETTAVATRVQSETTNWPTVVRFLTCCYLLGVVLLLGRFVLGMQGAGRIRRSSRLLDDPDILRAITRRAKALGLRNLPPVLLCQQLLVPAVVGMMRPAILFPVAMISGLTPQQVEDVLTHELAHIRRYDYLVNVMQRVVESFLFFHPAVWFVSRQIRIEREHCCDDSVIALGTAPVDYATALLNVVQAGSTAESRMSLSQLVTLPAVGKRSELRRRIERLINGHHQPQVYFTRKGIIMTSLTTMIVLAASMLFSATFQDEEEREDQPTAQTATQSENETELSEKLDVSGLPEVASKNGSLKNESDSKSQDAARNESNALPAEGESSQKSRKQPKQQNKNLQPSDQRKKSMILDIRGPVEIEFVQGIGLILRGNDADVGKVRRIINLIDKARTGTEKSLNSPKPTRKNQTVQKRPDPTTMDIKIFPIKSHVAEEL
ncbi:MAG: M48 family metalloprotease, partial [Planctomycetes bacterium]|nr:M48 family metalloprotease [Planctomycetota bacterium]